MNRVRGESAGHNDRKAHSLRRCEGHFGALARFWLEPAVRCRAATCGVELKGLRCGHVLAASRAIIVTKAQLDQLEERGYLNPCDRGTRADECDAIANFLTDSLAKSR
jgi:hypothetical protein